MRKINDKEFLSVIRLDIDKRVKYFKNVVCDQCILWLSYDDQKNLIGNYDTNGNECVYIWPDQKYGLYFLNETKFKDEISAVNLKPMCIYKFLMEYIQELISNQIKVMVFPTENGGALFEAEDFKNMMYEELSRYDDLNEEYEI